MDIVVTGRHAQVTDRFREHLEEKLAKVPQLLPKVSRVDVVVTHEQTKNDSECVEITCHAKGPMIRAEACHTDKYAALDTALDKLYERLRRAGDRRRVSRGRRAPESVGRATGRLAAPGPESDLALLDETPVDGQDARFADTPIEVREKVHASTPMTLEEALARMELVGHDFFLFHDSETDRPSVVYRRRGWSYGVIHLEVAEDGAAHGVADAVLAGSRPA
ncbi:ribosome hibernation-promoting factor, HPF/YfiA family [Lapillicoccus jejuensis]|uniref:Ribosome hibernation promoting factor n=1 Tax=Lapillicoccus jejuensis TaxID=402171 RepID=A0A542E2L0_9MICO|nr:ribosome-associated translation inhibitor RaiA [Lapillicoccus jejuensis]TQJ09555.1 ribosomal subunit interface protein [Lapillicoccus jejuensis]